MNNTISGSNSKKINYKERKKTNNALSIDINYFWIKSIDY